MEIHCIVTILLHNPSGNYHMNHYKSNRIKTVHSLKDKLKSILLLWLQLTLIVVQNFIEKHLVLEISSASD